MVFLLTRADLWPKGEVPGRVQLLVAARAAPCIVGAFAAVARQRRDLPGCQVHLHQRRALIRVSAAQ